LTQNNTRLENRVADGYIQTFALARLVPIFVIIQFECIHFHAEFNICNTSLFSRNNIEPISRQQVNGCVSVTDNRMVHKSKMPNYATK